MVWMSANQPCTANLPANQCSPRIDGSSHVRRISGPMRSGTTGHGRSTPGLTGQRYKRYTFRRPSRFVYGLLQHKRNGELKLNKIESLAHNPAQAPYSNPFEVPHDMTSEADLFNPQLSRKLQRSANSCLLLHRVSRSPASWRSDLCWCTPGS